MPSRADLPCAQVGLLFEAGAALEQFRGIGARSFRMLFRPDGDKCRKQKAPTRMGGGLEVIGLVAVSGFIVKIPQERCLPR